MVGGVGSQVDVFVIRLWLADFAKTQTLVSFNPIGSIWMFPKIGVPQNAWLIMENSTRMDDLGVPLFLETPIYGIFTYIALIFIW